MTLNTKETAHTPHALVDKVVSHRIWVNDSETNI